jgi:Tfp pilus assembly PilM family ATPase
MPLAAAAKMRRQESDRREDRRDPEIVQAIAEALTAAYERISQELLLCLRYHNVAFRGRTVTQLLIGGGEATAEMATAFGEALNLPSTLSDPFRALETAPNDARRSVWDVATGLAFREELS